MWDHSRLTAVHISKHSLFRLKITVGCLTRAYPSIHTTLRITVVFPTCTYPSIRTKTCRHVGLPGKTRAVGTSTRADACACVGDPQPRLFEFNHSDIQGTAQKSPRVNTFLKPSQKKKKNKACHCLGVWVWWSGHGNTGQRTRPPHRKKQNL